MFDRAVRQIVEKILKEKYSHAIAPNIIYAKIISKKNKDNYYLYSIKKVNSHGIDDIEYSIIPNIKSEYDLELESMVIVACVEGSCENVYIIGRDNR